MIRSKRGPRALALRSDLNKCAQTPTNIRFRDVVCASPPPEDGVAKHYRMQQMTLARSANFRGCRRRAVARFAALKDAERACFPTFV